jgi:hypothetical protein
MRKVIALCGRRRSGKDTLADLLVSREGYVRVQVSSKLKRVAGLLFDLDVSEFEQDTKDSPMRGWGGHLTPRHVLQTVGEDVKSRFGQDFWMRGCLREVADALSAGAEGVVVSDVRFPHEASALRKAYDKECLVVRLLRDRDLDKGDDQHTTETSQAGIFEDFALENEGSIEDLWRSFLNAATRH